MRPKSILFLLALFSFLTLLTACGQTGRLYLPPLEPSQSHPDKA